MLASSNDDSFKDLPGFLRLRALLESAQFGQPLPKALPARKLADACDEAATAGGPVKWEELDAAAGERPLAKALCSYIRQGRAADGASHGGRCAQCSICARRRSAGPTISCARSRVRAVRYAGNVRHKAYSTALTSETSKDALAVWTSTLQTEHETMVDRLLQDEAASPTKNGRPSKLSAQLPPATGSPAGNGPYCLL